MKRSLKLMAIGVLAGGLLTGCPDKPPEEPPATTATQTAAQPDKPEEKTPDAAAPEAPAVDEANYNKALFERTCVTAKVDDVEKQKAIITEINARYGFDDASWTAAAEAMKAKPEVTAALETKMKDCTAEMAEGFAKADGAEGDKPEGDKPEGDKPKPAAKKWKEGAYSATVNGGGLKNTKIDIKINADGKMSARLQGSREDKGFSVPAKGEIGKDGKFTLSGSQAQNNARVSGTYKSGQITGTITGSVHKKPFKASFNAK